MKKYLCSIACLLLLGSVAFAQVLASAIPNDPGIWTIALFGGRQSNVGNNSSLAQTLYGIAGAYGLGNRTELDLIYGYGSFSGVQGMAMQLSCYTLSLKYNLLMEVPLSLALGASTTLLSQKDNFAGSPNGNNYGFKILVSKVISSFIPYACLNRSYTSLGGDSIATEVTLGGIWLAAPKWAWLAENIWQLQDSGYTSGQFSLCVAYTL
ncbi:MAG: hypothetical protein KJ732_06870 [Candidatus Margulisbacteria bacterium]|nr:hypothetical protein [Candidatus Margulisiibacteriota bacterium]